MEATEWGGEEETGSMGCGWGGSDEHSQVSGLGLGGTERLVRQTQKRALTADRNVGISSSWPGLTGWDMVSSSQERAWTAGRRLRAEAWP